MTGPEKEKFDSAGLRPTPVWRISMEKSTRSREKVAPEARITGRQEKAFTGERLLDGQSGTGAFP